MKTNQEATSLRQLSDDLIEAVKRGDCGIAESLACQLASLKAKLNVELDSSQRLSDGASSGIQKGQFMVKVEVEDRVDSGASFNLPVSLADRIEDLKRKVRENYGIPEKVQRWIIAKKIREDKDTLNTCLTRGTKILYLYLVPAYAVGIQREHHDLPGLEHNPVNHPTIAQCETVPKMLSGEQSITESQDSGNLDVTSYCIPKYGL